MTRAIMIQGTGSNVGKSMLVAGLCRAAYRRGIKVAPFKPQNMSNNAAVTADGGEIGRAQALQAQACKLDPHSDMNPVLIKPETDQGAQIIVHGRRFGHSHAAHFGEHNGTLLGKVSESFDRLKSHYDLVIVEGAGSPAEINLRDRDIANMGFARHADVPVILAGDIDRGGVIAQIVGTKTVIDPGDAAQITGFLVNKFRGNTALFADGYRFIAEATGWRGLGVIPWFADAWKLPAEDAVDLAPRQNAGKLHIVCLTLSRIANFDDLDPLKQEDDVKLTMLGRGEVLPVDCDIVIIPGTKSTRGDLDVMRAQGWDIDIAAHIRRGGHVLGICGGYQMLGTAIHDPEGTDGEAGTSRGLGHLDIVTTMQPAKHVGRIRAHHAHLHQEFSGYEIHMGTSTGADRSRPFATYAGGTDGATSPNGRVTGTYFHGLFADDAFRAAWLAQFGVETHTHYATGLEATLDNLAAHLDTHADLDALFGLAR